MRNDTFALDMVFRRAFISSPETGARPVEVYGHIEFRGVTASRAADCATALHVGSAPVLFEYALAPKIGPAPPNSMFAYPCKCVSAEPLGGWVGLRRASNAALEVSQSLSGVAPLRANCPSVLPDAVGYRIGYGGGYFDRTLAALHPRPLAVGVGFELARLDSICSEPHVQVVDAMVTEAGLFRPAR